MLAALSLFVCALALGASWQSSSADVLAEDDRKAADAFIKANNLGTSVIQIENMLTGARCGQCFGRCTLTARRARTVRYRALCLEDVKMYVILLTKCERNTASNSPRRP